MICKDFIARFIPSTFFPFRELCLPALLIKVFGNTISYLEIVMEPPLATILLRWHLYHRMVQTPGFRKSKDYACAN